MKVHEMLDKIIQSTQYASLALLLHAVSVEVAPKLADTLQYLANQLDNTSHIEKVRDELRRLDI